MSQHEWHKSSFSTGANNDCVEVASGPGGLIRLRESDDPAQVITTAPTSWVALLAAAKAGRLKPWQKSSFSTGPEGACLEAAPAAGGIVGLRESDDPAQVITTTPTAWATLLTTVKAGRLPAC
ncbi:DUF397 domain-containing protein [Streptomyces cinnamoneus]|uniref:DUF397 domain-containing protein n=1 Tax=Streptomyces cinnamoneus TaxID=53446 RepID=UPI0033C6F451